MDDGAQLCTCGERAGSAAAAGAAAAGRGETKGGERGTRNPKPRVANAVLGQLSYVPEGQQIGAISAGPAGWSPRSTGRSRRAAPAGGAAPPARRRQRRATGPDAWAPCELQVSPTNGGWAWEDLNLRPHPYQGCAL